MKRLLFLSVCILLVGAMVAQAEIVQVKATRTSYSGTMDKVVLNIVGLVDNNGDNVPNNYVINTLIGTWTANGGSFDLPGTASTFSSNIHNLGDLTPGAGGDVPVTVPTPPATWVNMMTLTPDVPTRSGGATSSNSFFAGISEHLLAGQPYALGITDLTPGDNLYYNADDDMNEQVTGYGFDNTLLGTFYVSKATTWTPGTTIFTTTGNDGANIGMCMPTGGDARALQNSSIQIVPEPTSLALLGCGLIGLLAYAWRKRK